jgi:CHAT domain-containing protein/Tfp pilus assembly protein PilF
MRPWGSRSRVFTYCVWLTLLPTLIPLKDSGAIGAESEYDRALQLFVHGDLEGSQQAAESGYNRFQAFDRKWTSEFLLLKAQSLLQRGMYDDALRTLRDRNFEPAGTDALIRSLTIESIALLRQQQPVLAGEKIAQASDLCKAAALNGCGEVLKAQGIFAVAKGNFEQARELFLAAHVFAENHHDKYLDASTVLNLGWTALQVDHFDEALDWLTIASRLAGEISAEDLKEKCLGNLGWAYYQLGDDQRALQQFLDAERTAEQAGNLRNRLKWLSTAGYVYRDSGDLPRAMECYRKAFSLANQLNSREDIEIALEDLAQLSVMNGDLKAASAYLDQVGPMETAGGEKPSPTLMLTRGELAAALHSDKEAEADIRSLWNNPDSPTTLHLLAGSDLATLYESQQRPAAAEKMYKSVLTAYESARTKLRREETQLPFGANATQVYDDYIHLLVGEGRSREALAIADESRARTLEQGLDAEAGKSPFRAAAIDPRRKALISDATLLFYWLGARQSYLWVITPARITMFLLPPGQQIAARVQSYRNAILNLQDPQKTRNQDGIWLYNTLVAPARALIQPGKSVVILDDGALSELNFDTLLVPGSESAKSNDADSATHYLLEDFVLVSAPSLSMISAPQKARDLEAKILLLGDPVSPSQDFPSLPLLGYEMTKIESHFSRNQMTVFAGSRATPAAYLASHPSQYSYIDFVSHATASSNDPLESAIVLSRSSADENSFKLYAREIIKLRINAQLVTISACYGSGTRLYAGEGLVGLSWAFLRAGAQRVIGAMWEVSDISTPRLMDSFYGHLANGDSPRASLRFAKLESLHSSSRFSLPFYWAAFQMYDRQ